MERKPNVIRAIIIFILAFLALGLAVGLFSL